MTLMTWNPAWDTGIEQIDEQHRRLLAQFDDLLLAIKENHPEDRIPGLLQFLSTYVETHFSLEEQHMEATHYTGYLGHKAIHDGMRVRVLNLIEGYRQDPSIMTEGVIDFLTDWLVGHINEQDRRMARHLIQAGASQSGHEP